MSAGRGGAGRGQGRNPLDPSDETKRITITLLGSQLERLPSNKSEAIRSMIDKHLAEQDKLYVRLFEDNAGGLWLVDTEQEIAVNVSEDGKFCEDAADLLAGSTAGWDEDSIYPYGEGVEQWPETKLIAEYDGETVKLYPGAMGHSGKEYTGI